MKPFLFNNSRSIQGQQVFKLFLTILLFFITFQLDAQNVEVRGQVKGLISDSRKSKPVVLSHVKVSVTLDSKPVVVKTNLAGVYIIDLLRDKRYLMTVSRTGYNAKSLFINTKNLPTLKNKKHIEITDLDFLLLKSDSFPDDVSLKEDMGQLVFDPKKGQFNLTANKDFKQHMNHRDISLKLIKKNITYVYQDEEEKIEKKSKNNLSEKAVELDRDKDTSISITGSVLDLQSIDDRVKRSEEHLKIRRSEIESAKIDLDSLRKSAVTREDSLLVQKLEAQILAAEIDLAYAEEVIAIQKDQLKMQSRLISFYIISSILLLLIAGVVFWFYRNKYKMNLVLAEKNRLITEGINYANRIQNSILKTEEELKAVLPEMFLLFKPRDIVSGDFYWLSQVGDKIVVSAIDCTGHGVPGAFISMIGNTLLNEIVNNKKIIDPGRILEELHVGVIDALQQDAGGKQAQDGMDMALCVIDKKTDQLLYAGAKNHLFKVDNGRLEVIRADIESIGGRALRKKDGYNKIFTTQRIDITKGCTFYLFSDGYMDQFGGPKGEKFNLNQFTDLLIDCSNEDVSEQKRIMESRFKKWKGKERQLDDVLVMGLKF